MGPEENNPKSKRNMDELEAAAQKLTGEVGLHELWGEAALLPGYNKKWWMKRQEELVRKDRPFEP